MPVNYREHHTLLFEQRSLIDFHQITTKKIIFRYNTFLYPCIYLVIFCSCFWPWHRNISAWQIDQVQKDEVLSRGGRGREGGPTEINLCSICQQLVLGRASLNQQNKLETRVPPFHYLWDEQACLLWGRCSKFQKVINCWTGGTNVSRQCKHLDVASSKNAGVGKLVQISRWQRILPGAAWASSPQNIKTLE